MSIYLLIICHTSPSRGNALCTRFVWDSIISTDSGVHHSPLDPLLCVYSTERPRAPSIGFTSSCIRLYFFLHNIMHFTSRPERLGSMGHEDFVTSTPMRTDQTMDFLRTCYQLVILINSWSPGRRSFVAFADYHRQPDLRCHTGSIFNIRPQLPLLNYYCYCSHCHLHLPRKRCGISSPVAEASHLLRQL